jgi:hypothetical protein
MAVKRDRAQKQHVPALQPASNAAQRPPPARVALAEPRRSFAPRGIAALLAPVLRPAFRKRAPAAAQLLADWPMLAGPQLAARAAPVKFAAGTLTLACSGPVAMELQLSAPAIIQRLNLGLGSAMVERLRFMRQTPALAGAVPGLARRQFERVAPPENLPDGALGEALAKLYQGVRSKS